MNPMSPEPYLKNKISKVAPRFAQSLFSSQLEVCPAFVGAFGTPDIMGMPMRSHESLRTPPP